MSLGFVILRKILDRSSFDVNVFAIRAYLQRQSDGHTDSDKDDVQALSPLTPTSGGNCE